MANAWAPFGCSHAREVDQVREARATSAERGRWTWRLAGGLLVVVGAVNALFGLASLASDLIMLSTGVAGGLLAAGVATAAAGALVWRGSRVTTLVALTVFGLLLVVQAADALQGGAADVEGVAGSPVARFGLLILIVVALGLAAMRLRAPSRSGTGVR